MTSRAMIAAMAALALPLAHAKPAMANKGVTTSTAALPGAQFRTMTIVEVEKSADPTRPCPRSSFTRDKSQPENAALAGLAAGLISSFAGKAIDGFAAWLKKRGERLDGTRTAIFTGEFYFGKDMKAACYIFEAADFANNGTTVNGKVYIELVPVGFDGSTFTLKPVYLDYSGSVARAGKNREKFTSLVVSMKYNTPASVDKDTNEINQTELSAGPTFTMNFGKLRSGGSAYDHQALRGVSAGLGQMPPQFDKDAVSLMPIAYEATAIWSESAEPSPLYTAAADAVGENTDELTATATKLVNRVLGIEEEDDKEGAE